MLHTPKFQPGLEFAHETTVPLSSRNGKEVVQVRANTIGRLVGSSNYEEVMRASTGTGGERLNQRRIHLRNRARVCNDVRGPTRIWTLLVAKFAILFTALAVADINLGTPY